jgi:predicted amidohydrolase
MKVACVQVCAADDMARNLAVVGECVKEAGAAGANLITTPENVSLMAADRAQLLHHAVEEAEHPAVAHFSNLAATVGRWVLAGSIGVAAGDGRIFNRSLLFGPDGAIAARYDKIHMFDVTLPNGEVYNESRNYRPGSAAVTADLGGIRLGMTVCYDIRFPSLYRLLGQAGAQVITVPSAFTATTGRAHWTILLRARAIETGAYVVAPAQVGSHPAKRVTYGHSMVVAPWGEVILDAGETVGVSYADLDLARIKSARESISAWSTTTDFAAP